MKTFTVIDGVGFERILGVQPTLDHLWAEFKRTGRLRTLQVSWKDGDTERKVRADRFFAVVGSEKDLPRLAGAALVHIEPDEVLDRLGEVAWQDIEAMDDVRAIVTDKLFTAFRAMLLAVMDTEGVVFAKEVPEP